MNRMFLLVFAVVELVFLTMAIALKNEPAVLVSSAALIVAGLIGLAIAIADRRYE